MQAEKAAIDNAIPRDENCVDDSGWDWTDDTMTGVRFCTKSCNRIKKGECPVVAATFGCEQIIVIVK